MRLLIRCLVLCIVVTAAAVPAAARGRPTPPTPTQPDGPAAAVPGVEASGGRLHSDRPAHIVADLTARDSPAIDTLLDARQRIHDRQAELLARRHDQDVTMADLTAQRDQIAAELNAMAAAMPPPAPRPPLPRASRSASALGQRLLRGAPSFVCPIDGPLAFTDALGP